MEHNDLATDRGRSWVVAACCCFCNLTFYGVSRLSGMMLVAATHTFHVSRANAAVPFSLSTAIRNLAGVFVGHLAHRFGVAPIVAVGCFIASVGAGLCFFAKDMQWLTVCWGGVFGIGFGLSTCLLPLAINQNFIKHNGTASGISYSGSYIGSFILPPIVVWLLDKFGLQGTFLIISGGVLNVFVAAMLLKQPKSTKKRSKNDVERVYSSGNNIPIETVEAQWHQNFAFSNGETLLRRNIKRVYDYSQNRKSDYDSENKLNSKMRISLTDSTHPLRETADAEGSLKEKVSSNSNCKSNNTSQSKAINNESPTQQLSAASLLNGNRELVHKKTHPMVNSPSNEIDMNISDSCAKETVTGLKPYYRKSDFETRSLSKGKFKVKYKMKLQKLKKVLLTSVLNKARIFRTECLQTDNVKLTSFRYLHTYLCPNLSNVPISHNHLYLSSPQNISSKKSINKERSYSTYRFLKKFNSYSIIFPKEQRCDKSMCSDRFHEVIEPEEVLSRVNVSLKDTAKPSFFKVHSHKSNLTTNNLDSTEANTSCASHLEKCDTSGNDRYIDISRRKLDILNLDADDVTSTAGNPSDGTDASCHKPNISPRFLVPEVKFKPEDGGLECPGDIPKSPEVKGINKCFSDWFCMLKEPMYIVISSTMAIQTFIVVCVVTTIEDYAKDIGIPENRVHYALMALSIANLVGTLTLGAITDRGFMSRHRFLSVCFLGMSLSLVALSLVVVSLTTLLCVIVIYGLLESGVIITFPILTKQFVKGEKRQAVAIASSNVLSAPTVMLVPMLIGHFRDNIGCYTGLFHVLGATSLTCSLVWIVAPSIVRRRKLNKLKTKIEQC